MANFQMWPRISENQKKDGKGQASVGLLLPAGGPRQGLTRGPQAGVGWVGLLAGPPAGRERSRGANTWAPGAADGPRREEAQDLKRRPSALAYRCSAAWGSAGVRGLAVMLDGATPTSEVTGDGRNSRAMAAACGRSGPARRTQMTASEAHRPKGRARDMFNEEARLA